MISSRDQKNIGKFSVILGFGLWYLALLNSKVENIDSLGLLQATPRFIFCAPILVSLGTLLLYKLKGTTWWFYATIFVYITTTSFTSILIEGTSRYTFSYKSLGFGQNIFETGKIDFSLFYLNWPGVHIISSTLQMLTETTPLQLLRYFPLYGDFLFLLEIFLLARIVGLNTKQAGLLLFFGILLKQNTSYFVPFTAAMYLRIVIIFLTLKGWKSSQLFYVVFALMILILALTVTHLLTTIVTIIFILLLVLFKQYSKSHVTPSFLLLSIVLMFTWQFFLTSDWTLHSAVPKIITMFQASIVSETVEGVYQLGFSGTQGHTLIVSSRVIFAFIVFVLSIIGLFYAVKLHKNVLVPIVGISSAIALVFSGSYGGEIVARMYIYATPFFALCFCYIFLSRQWRSAFSIFIIFLSPLSLILLYGNEIIDYVRPHELDELKFFEAMKPEDYLLKVTPERIWPLYSAKNIYRAQDSQNNVFYIDGVVFETNRNILGMKSESKYSEKFTHKIYDNGFSMININGF